MRPMCPACDAEIPPQAINASTDIAHCKVCNTIHKLSEVQESVELVEALAEKAPSGTWSRDTIDGWVVGASLRSMGTAAFFWVFTIFWNSIVSIFLVVTVSRLLGLPPGITMKEEGTDHPMSLSMAWFMMLFLTPFGLVGIGTFITAMCASFGRQEVTVGAGRGGIFFGVGGIGWTRRFDPSMVTRIDVKKSMVKRNEDTVRQIEIEAEKTYTLGSHMSERRKVWVCAELKRRFLGAGGA